MKRLLSLMLVLVALAALSGVSTARLICTATGNCFTRTTNPPTNDLWAVGGQVAGNAVKAYTEIALDYTGSLVPTSTLGAQNLGSPTLPFQNVYSVNATVTGSDASGVSGTTPITGVGGTAATQSSVLGVNVNPPITAFALVASSVTPVNASFMLVGGITASTTLTSQPEVSTTTVVGGSTLLPFGTFLTIASTMTAANIVYTSSTSSNATGLILGASTRTITKNKTLYLWLDNISVPAVWREIAYGND